MQVEELKSINGGFLYGPQVWGPSCAIAMLGEILSMIQAFTCSVLSLRGLY